ncbi:hypothetical protein Z517_05683 [Fonsecaea pedrosoi CBS 271.37]|uniref:Unplaced genomic scaffold supercont1.3, whole genome shotgun sequence n=1 Tax=Fonsecaea pedrosoi CBS 271.37 TaxID=1442368 RepID=A0A0D2DXX8_9EURO|nr:uncharacterized protein Z517_05683 [Fonsecaea pedrosoi CBS 271.37]KIW82656.1 hypothetical protein Z517_05683 [Fonsecaea pedrosoi CBS 271.37]
MKDRLEGVSGDQLSDDFIFGIIMATVAESRISPPGVSNIHLKAYEAVVAARGGLRAILLASADPIPHTSHLMPLVVSDPLPDEVVLWEHHSDQAIDVLQFLAKGENKVDPSKLIFSTTGKQVPHKSERASSLKLTMDDDLYPPLASKAIEPFLQPDIWEYPRYTKISSHFLALFIMVSTLWKLRRTSLLQRFFLDRADTLFVKSSALDSDGKYMITLEGFSWLVIKAGFEVYEAFGDKKVIHCNKVDMLMDAASGLKLLMVCDEPVRRDLIAFLCRCLLDIREMPSIDSD